MNRVTVINTLISRLGYSRYLEIGCNDDGTFRQITAPTKTGVDPVRGGTIRTTSDAFFARSPGMFDVIFIDGDHHHAQVHRDVVNSLAHLAPLGTIVMHDCLPPDPGHESLNLCGTTWRAFVQTRTRADLDSFVCDFDYGIGIVRKAPNPAIVQIAQSMDALTYADLSAHRARWMRPATMAHLVGRIASWPKGRRTGRAS